MENFNLQGIVEKIIYVNKENLFTVLLFRLEDDEKIVVTGNFLDLKEGTRLKIQGNFVSHPKYGRQFKADSYTPVLPETKNGIELFLASGLISGVGKVFAHRIVSYFGHDTLRILDEEPHRLLEIEGIGKKKLEAIKRSWEKERYRRDVLISLQSMGLSQSQSLKIFAKYKEEAPQKVKENPYEFIKEIKGIGFKTADRIALDVGFTIDDERRLCAGINYCLSNAIEDGHIFFWKNELIANSSSELGVEKEKIERTLEKMQEQGEVITEKKNENLRIYNPQLYWMENEISKILFSMLCFERRKEKKSIYLNKKLFKEDGEICLTDEQILAINLGLTHRVVVITGGPGTGKTTLIKGIINEGKNKGWKISLCAPTGRAAKRLSFATQMEAMTIHRLLEYDGESGRFRKNQYFPLVCDMVIVDETSMVDLPLFYALISALSSNCGLVLVGDADQLPSIGPGNILRDIIASKIIPTVKLTKIFRQEEGSLIITNAHKILKGELPVLKTSENWKNTDFYFIEKDDPLEIYRIIIELVTKRLPEHFGFDPVENIQVISPMYKGEIGVDNLNKGLRKILNPLTKESEVFCKDDKVMQTVNNYNKEVFNGDIGKIEHAEKGNGIIVNYYGRLVKYDESEMDELVLAYSISVHKSQGSEYQCVVIPIHTQHYIMLRRSLLYTAVTRGKKLVILIGSKKALILAIKNDRELLRNTTLCERLTALKEQHFF